MFGRNGNGNGNGNGHRPPPMAPARDVPILGQSAKIHSCMPTTVLICGCEAKVPLVLAGMKSAIKCPACGRVHLLELTIQVKVGVGMEAADGAPAPGLVT